MISLKVPVLKSEGDAGRFAWQSVHGSFIFHAVCRLLPFVVVCCRLLFHGPSSWGIQRCHELLGLLSSCDGLCFSLEKRIGVAAVEAFKVQSLWTEIQQRSLHRKCQFRVWTL